MNISDLIVSVVPFVQGFLKSVWATVPSGVGTAVGSYFGTKHVIARLEELNKKRKKRKR